MNEVTSRYATGLFIDFSQITCSNEKDMYTRIY